MLRSRNRLLDDVARWQRAGWVTPEGAAAIRAELAARHSGIGLAGVLATLSAVLVGFAVMSFVAANWQVMSKAARLAVILAGMWGSFGGALWLRSRDHGALADAALLSAVAIYGAGIMLIAQMYHMDGHPPDAVLMWAGGALATGLLTRSNPAIAAALVLFCAWSLMETIGGAYHTRIHWAFLPAWALVASGFALTRWRPGLHLLAVALSGWIVVLGYQVGGGRGLVGHLIVTLIGTAIAGGGVGFGPWIDRWRPVSGAIVAYGFSIAFLGAFALQFVANPRGAETLVLGALVLLAILATLAWAWRTDHRGLLWLAYAAFSLEIFSLYLKKIGTLLGTSAFFLVSGLMVAALAWAALRLHARSERQTGGAA
ncbi:MAG: DUF2157 domain-containing protein [Hyphomicrobiaceae bacterium]|nr:DUF2157 domain-containing protein [Hyphomicrobiaceae bacterium]